MTAAQKERLRQQALRLPKLERSKMARTLVASVVDDAGPLHPGWAAELARRSDDADAGRSMLEGEGVLKRLRKKYASR
ncbi:MAG: addiction module protein [Deltaproteobacteria bacterium]|nr:addiction module protein [Deltaproteobacteria bacterium]